MHKFPKNISIFLKDNKFEFIELIQKSEWKETYILKIRQDKKFFILKAYSENTPNIIKNKFISEIEFYKNNNREYLPKLKLHTDSILILEYIQGVTLRENLIKNEMIEASIQNLFINIDQLYTDSKQSINNTYLFDNAFSHLSALIQSGPIQTKGIKISFLKHICNKIILVFLKLKLKIIIRNIDTSTLKKGFVHGDFHYNNILISNKKVKFIDFENIKYNGFFDFDILYLLVMMEIYIGENKVFMNEVNNFLNNNKKLIEIYNLYKQAIKLNKKFKMIKI